MKYKLSDSVKQAVQSALVDNGEEHKVPRPRWAVALGRRLHKKELDFNERVKSLIGLWVRAEHKKKMGGRRSC